MVNFATRWIGLIMMASLLARGVAAEDLPLPDPDGLELPDNSMLPSFDEESLPMGELYDGPYESAGSSVLAGPPQMLHESPEMGPTFDGQYVDSLGENCAVEPTGHFYPWDSQPAPIASSGTWLNRGLWYAETDVVALYRIWQRADIFMVAQDPNVNIPNSLQSIGLGLNTNRTIFLQSAHPGEDAGVRATLGRFLFRDDHNRDHTAEFTAYSAGDWVSSYLLTSENPFGLFVSFAVDGGNTDFDGSSLQRVTYSSRFNSFELNYRLKWRLGRDRMVMDPNGGWRREASSGFNRNFLAGFRFLEFRDTFDWQAEDILVNGDDGRYIINTDNELFGFQMGQGIEYGTGRWSLGISGKVGLFVNDAEGHQQLTFTADDDNDFDRHSAEDELSFLGEAHILGRYHLTPSCSLRAGLDFLVVESLALAPRQINFIDGYSKLDTGADPYFLGGSLGFECYW